MDRLLPHIELLQNFYRSHAIAFGSSADLHRFSARLGQMQVVEEELASLLRSVLYSENLVLDRTELLALLCASLDGGLPGDTSREGNAPSRELVLFVNRTVRSVHSEPAERSREQHQPETSAMDGARSWSAGASPWQQLPPRGVTARAALGRLAHREHADAAETPGPVQEQTGTQRSLSSAIRQAMERDLEPYAPAPQELPRQQALPTQAIPPTKAVQAEELAPEAETIPPAHAEFLSPPVPIPHPRRLRQPAVWWIAAALIVITLGAVLLHMGHARQPSAQAHLDDRQSQTATGAIAAVVPAAVEPAPHPAEPPSASAPAPAVSATCALTPTGGKNPVPSGLPQLTSAASGHPIPMISTATACDLVLTAARPVYPTLASLTQLQGTVSLELVISPQGAVTMSKVLSGPALLRGAAEQAVRQWRFRPYMQGGQAIEVATPVTVTFRPPTATETPGGTS